MILAGDWVRWVGGEDVGVTENGSVGKVTAVAEGYCNVLCEGYCLSWKLAHVEQVTVVAPIQIDHVKPSDRVAWLPDARESIHVQRLTEDNARLAESMAKLEDAIGLMRETVAEQNKIIAEQARELYRFRCVK